MDIISDNNVSTNIIQPKIALCFIISYKHILNKEQIWKEWIEPNKDIINVYFHYKELKLIKSEWIHKHALPQHYIIPTSYFKVVGAYMSLILFGLKSDSNNKWFCFLTDSCAPIISPAKFRELFFLYHSKSILKWNYAWWNVNFHKRANLRLLPKMYHLGHDPWFILTRDHAIKCFNYTKIERPTYNIICNGGLANESIFIVILKQCGEINNILNASVNVANWEIMSSANSPYVFKSGSTDEIEYIKKLLEKNKFSIFLRKVDVSFPDTILRKYLLL